MKKKFTTTVRYVTPYVGMVSEGMATALGVEPGVGYFDGEDEEQEIEVTLFAADREEALEKALIYFPPRLPDELRGWEIVSVERA